MDFIKNIEIGTVGEATLVVKAEHTVGHLAEGMPMVFSTPAMITLMETSAAKAINAYLPKGWVSVGYEVNIKHLAATPVGRTVTATAKIISVEGKTVTCSVEAHDGVTLIGKGTHSRAPIDLVRFQKRL